MFGLYINLQLLYVTEEKRKYDDSSHFHFYDLIVFVNYRFDRDLNVVRSIR